MDGLPNVEDDDDSDNDNDTGFTHCPPEFIEKADADQIDEEPEVVPRDRLFCLAVACPTCPTYTYTYTYAYKYIIEIE